MSIAVRGGPPDESSILTLWDQNRIARRRLFVVRLLLQHSPANHGLRYGKVLERRHSMLWPHEPAKHYSFTGSDLVIGVDGVRRSPVTPARQYHPRRARARKATLGHHRITINNGHEKWLEFFLRRYIFIRSPCEPRNQMLLGYNVDATERAAIRLRGDAVAITKRSGMRAPRQKRHH